MNIDELKSEWQSDAPNGVLPVRTEAGMLDYVKQRQRSFNRRLLFRDGLETLVAAAVFIGFALMLPTAGWVTRTGLVVVMTSCIFIVWRLHATRRRQGRASSDRPVAEVLRSEIRRTDDQIRLLETVLWWYFSPLGVGAVLVVGGIRGLTWFTVLYALGVVTLGGVIHYLNQYSVRRELRPRRRELESMLAAMEPDEYAGATSH